MAGRDPLIDPEGLRCDPGLIEREVNSGSEIDVDEEEVDDWSNASEGNTNINTGKWIQASRKKKKRKERDSDDDKSEREIEGKEIKVILRFQSPCILNPLKVSNAIHRLIVEVWLVKTLRDGNLLISCRNKDQQQRLMKCKTLLGKNIKPQTWEERGKVMGVISGVSTEITEEHIQRNIKGGLVTKVKRLPYTRNGVREQSMSVMLIFDEDKIPERVRIGYLSYMVRPYIPPPTRCFKCQRYGHVAAACRGKIRCAKCGGEHEYGKCKEGSKIICCNCGREHRAAYKGCEAHKKSSAGSECKNERKDNLC